MTINDKVFGELTYEHNWYKDASINFLGQDVEIFLSVSGEEDGLFEEGQYLSYTKLIEKWEIVYPQVLPKILEYYKEERWALGYDVEENEDYPLIETVEEMANHIELTGIKVPYFGALGGKRNIGILFECSWDEENGLGIRLLDEEIHKIGYQDVAL